jgi:DNA uptake protein ComE-like DNA-binding protein
MKLTISALAVAGVALAGAAQAQVGRSATIKDPNVATEAELSAVPGITPAIAKAIVSRRPFAGITEFDQLLQQQGLTREQITPVYSRLFVHVNLDTASTAEILLVPGVGPKMAHEFEEYRPYTGGLAEFRREIGKYVDSAEVARLEQYVFVPIKLNSASDEDILTIPGMGRRMLREFKEYRPYDGIAKFRKEIGKYVDGKELARLERFVVAR